MKTVAFFPIKLNNERTPGKNVKPFSDGTPLMYFVQKSLLELKKRGVLEEVYCYCSQEAVKAHLLDGVTFLRRPEFLDKKETLGRAIYERFVDSVAADIYVLAHATSPFVSVSHMEECIRNVRSGAYDSAFCARKIQNFLWQDGQPLNFDLANPPRTQDMKPIYQELSTPYVFTTETFQKYHSRTGPHPYICVANEIEGTDIDYPEDFLVADAIYSSLIKTGKLR